MDSRQTHRRIALWHWLIFGSLAAAGLIVFWPTLGFDFVNWDDPAYVWHNDLIKSLSPASLYGVATETVTRNYAPLTISTLLLDHKLWGMQPAGYHATNVLLHLLNGILVFLLTRRLSHSNFVSWLTAAAFLVHPVQIETVAWISSRKGLLSASFILGALIVRLRPEPTAKQDLWYILLLAAALLSKALAVVVPPIVLLYDVLIVRRRFSDALSRQVIPGLMALLLLLKTMSAQHSILGGLRSHMGLSLLQIVAVDSVILWRYIGMLILPADLCVLYDPPTSGISGLVIISGSGWLLFGGLVWKLRIRFPMLLWGSLTFLLLLLPVLNFVRITTLMNDRYLYLPCVVFFVFAAVGLQRMLTVSENVTGLRRPMASLLRWTLGLTFVAGAAWNTSEHLPVWRNSFTLWNHAMQHVPHLPVVRMQLALTHYDSGQTPMAIYILQRALLECRPDTADRERMEKAVHNWTEELRERTALCCAVPLETGRVQATSPFDSAADGNNNIFQVD